MKEIIIICIIAVLIILIITLYECYSVSNTSNQTCTSGQICCDPPSTSNAVTMFVFNICWVAGLTYPTFADYNKSNTSAINSLPSMSLVNYPNCNGSITTTSIAQWSLTTDTQVGSGIIYQYNPSNSSQQFCYALLIFKNSNTYTGVSVNYSFTNSSLTFNQENVSNGANTKVLQTNLVGTNGESVGNSYLGVCDLTPWINSLSSNDQSRIGTYNSSYTSQFTSTGITLPNPTNTSFVVIGENSTITTQVTGSSTCYRYNANWGTSVSSYIANTTSVGNGAPYSIFHY